MTPHTAASAISAPAAGIEPMRPTAVLLDLDGTISDSGPVITASIAETLAHFGYPEQSPGELLRYVGPPIRDGFQLFSAVPADQLPDVVADYRSRYHERMLHAPVFPGMADLIRDLHARGVPLALATSKRQSLATLIIEDAGLSPYFVAVRGASEDESRSAKADIVEDAITDLTAAGADLSRAVMVGDRRYDVEGAAQHGLPTVLVTWGYAEPQELAGAHAVASTAAELATLLS